jgi:hypothetical protein
VVTAALSATALFATNVASAHAVTRDQALHRATGWISHRVMYSQKAYYDGYRRDCSGFVSMMWQLKTSYTTRNINEVSYRISPSDLKPADAILRPGHIELFGGWKDKSRGLYWSVETNRTGTPAHRKVKHFGSRCTALRLRGIQDKAPAKVTPKPEKAIRPQAQKAPRIATFRIFSEGSLTPAS